MLGCWTPDAQTLYETVKPDDVASTLRDAVRQCVEVARNSATPTLNPTPVGVAVDAT